MMPGTKQKIAVTDKAGKMSQTQKYKVWAFHEVCDWLELPYRNDLDGKNGLQVKDAIIQRIKEKVEAPSEEETIFMDGVDVTLGGKHYHIKRLPAKQDREWRRSMGRFIQGVIEYCQRDSESLPELKGDNAKVAMDVATYAAPYILDEGVDGLYDMFWAYAVDLDRDKIEAESIIQSDEMIDAAMGVFDMMLPFFVSQGKRMIKMLTRTSALQQPSKQSA